MRTSGKADRPFETADLTLASFLYCRSFNFVGLKQPEDGRTIFVFARSPALELALVDYANDGVVPVRTFFMTLKDLKTLCRSNERDPVAAKQRADHDF